MGGLVFGCMVPQLERPEGLMNGATEKNDGPNGPTPPPFWLFGLWIIVFGLSCVWMGWCLGVMVYK
jgi:hypothetical protein